MVIYVDDIFVFAKNLESINDFVKSTSKSYEAKDLGEISNVLGVTVDRHDKIVSLNQKSYIESLTRKYNMRECRGAATPLEPGLKLSKDVESDSLNEDRKSLYREIIGSLMFVAHQDQIYYSR